MIPPPDAEAGAIDNYDPKASFADATVVARHDVRGDETEAVEFLGRIAGDGPVLELAIGTGRLALPLAARGLRVDGIDFAPEMIARLRAKPGGDQLHVVEGDFVDVPVSGRYALIFIAWNSFFNVLSQTRQVQCFDNVARHLSPDGVFVIEAYVPSEFHRLQNDQQVLAESVAPDTVRLGVLKHDGAAQTIEQSHVTLSRDGIDLNPVVQRYAWPGELDLMARLADLELAERWGGWLGEAFDAGAARHVSVYRSRP